MKEVLSVMVLFMMVLVAHAQVQPSIYSVDVRVPDRSQKVWQQAVGIALGSVLFRASGTPALLQTPPVIEAMKTPDRMMTSYQYRVVNDALGQSKLVLQIQFNQSAVQALIKQAQYASKPAEEEPYPVVQDVELKVVGITGIEDHVNVVNFLQDLNAVRYVRMNGVKNNVLSVRVSVVGGKAALLTELANQRRLVQMLNYDNTKALQFSWQQKGAPQQSAAVSQVSVVSPVVVLPATPGGASTESASVLSKPSENASNETLNGVNNATASPEN